MLRKRRPGLCAVCLALCLLLLAGCGGIGGVDGISGNGEPILSDPDYNRTPPPVQLAVFGGEEVVATDEDSELQAEIDLTNLSLGYVGARINAPGEKLLFVLTYGNEYQYPYPMAGDGSDEFFPLAMGSGSYTFAIYVNTTGNSYYTLLETTAQVSVDEFGPFLVQNNLVNYGPGSRVVQLSHELTANCSNDLEVVQVLYRWIVENIDYDYDMAAREAELREENYVPNLDAVLSKGAGICYDYSAVLAAMLRANGIPTRMVFGNANAGEDGIIYHAWNEIWLAETGWITIKIPVRPGEYTRVDTTFAADNDLSVGEHITDDNNYYEQYYH